MKNIFNFMLSLYIIFQWNWWRLLFRFIVYVKIGIHLIANPQMQHRLLFLKNTSTLFDLIFWLSEINKFKWSRSSFDHFPLTLYKTLFKICFRHCKHRSELAILCYMFLVYFIYLKRLKSRKIHSFFLENWVSLFISVLLFSSLNNAREKS